MDWLTKPQIAEFTKRYPSIDALLASDDYYALKQDVPRLVSIRVARIDETLLYFHGDYLDGTRSYMTREDEKWIGTKIERIFVHGPDHEIIGSTSSKERGADGRSMVRVKDILGKDPSLVRYIVVLSRSAWYKYGRDLSGPKRFGKLVAVEKHIVIYRAPSKMKGGMEALVKRTRLDKNVVLSTHDLLNGIASNDAEYKGVNNILDTLARRFTDAVYNKGLRSRIDRSEKRGMSGTFGGVKMLSFATAGRVMITLSRADKALTFIAAEDGDPRMGVQGLSGTVGDVRALVDDVARVFETELSAYNAMRDDEDVSIV